MSCVIIHGEDSSASRKHLLAELAVYKNQGIPVTWLNGTSLKLAELETALSSQELFASDKVVIIENLHKNTRVGAAKEAVAHLKDFLTSYDGSHLHLLIWEQRSLTATMLKNFPGSTAQEFKIKASVFDWLDSIGGPLAEAKKVELLNKARTSQDDYYLFIMLCRQVRLLLLAYYDGPIAGPPFIRAKLQKQAHYFSGDQLLALHTRLTKIDLETKLGQAGMTLSQQLDLLTIGV